jgi:hypothetical protein
MRINVCAVQLDLPLIQLNSNVFVQVTDPITLLLVSAWHVILPLSGMNRAEPVSLALEDKLGMLKLALVYALREHLSSMELNALSVPSPSQYGTAGPV